MTFCVAQCHSAYISESNSLCWRHGSVARVHCREAKQRLDCNTSKSDTVAFRIRNGPTKSGAACAPGGTDSKEERNKEARERARRAGPVTSWRGAFPRRSPAQPWHQNAHGGDSTRTRPRHSLLGHACVGGRFCELRERYISLYKPAVERALVYSEKKRKAERAERVGGDQARFMRCLVVLCRMGWRCDALVTSPWHPKHLTPFKKVATPRVPERNVSPLSSRLRCRP